jgi:hypothetical protein
MNQDEIKDFPSYQEMYDRFIYEGVDEEDADREAKDLALLCEEVKERFCHWWHTGELIDDLKTSKGRLSSLIAECRLYRFETAFIFFNKFYSIPLVSTPYYEEAHFICVKTEKSKEVSD